MKKKEEKKVLILPLFQKGSIMGWLREQWIPTHVLARMPIAPLTPLLKCINSGSLFPTNTNAIIFFNDNLQKKM